MPSRSRTSCPRRGLSRCFLPGAVLALSVALPLAAVAQDSTAGPAQDSTADTAQRASPQIAHERLMQFARAHLAINEARDDFHSEVARVHDAEGRQRAREVVDARIASILEEQEMSREEYDDVILLISLDEPLRTRFEEALAEIEAGTERDPSEAHP